MDTTNSSFNYSEGIFMALGPDDLPYAQEYIFLMTTMRESIKILS